MRDGWVHTDDLGYVGDKGYLFLVDRKKDMIDSGEALCDWINARVAALPAHRPRLARS